MTTESLPQPQTPASPKTASVRRKAPAKTISLSDEIKEMEKTPDGKPSKRMFSLYSFGISKGYFDKISPDEVKKLQNKDMCLKFKSIDDFSKILKEYDTKQTVSQATPAKTSAKTISLSDEIKEMEKTPDGKPSERMFSLYSFGINKGYFKKVSPDEVKKLQNKDMCSKFRSIDNFSKLLDEYEVEKSAPQVTPPKESAKILSLRDEIFKMQSTPNGKPSERMLDLYSFGISKGYFKKVSPEKILTLCNKDLTKEFSNIDKLGQLLKEFESYSKKLAEKKDLEKENAARSNHDLERFENAVSGVAKNMVAPAVDMLDRGL